MQLPAARDYQFADDNDSLVERLLTSARVRLGMEVAMVARIAEGQHEIAGASGPLESFGTGAGVCTRTSDIYCSLVADAREPLIIHDVTEDPRTSAMTITTAGDVGSYVGVPLEAGNGELYGTLCCLSHSADTSLGDRDLQYMTVIADILAEHLDAVERVRRARRAAIERIRGVLGSDDGLQTVFQPIVSLVDEEVVGVEALSRFPGPPVRPPNEWFADAAEAGLRAELELEAVRRSVERASQLSPPSYLSVNVSPDLLASGELVMAAQSFGPRLVVEVTEHAAVDQYEELLVAIDGLRSFGVRLAVDDAGSGYASFRHILSLRPEVIKLDLGLVRGIHQDSGRQSLARAIVGFASDFGASLVAEGVEVPEESAALRTLGVRYGQGYLFGRPVASLP